MKPRLQADGVGEMLLPRISMRKLGKKSLQWRLILIRYVISVFLITKFLLTLLTKSLSKSSFFGQGQNLPNNLSKNGIGDEGIVRLCVQKINFGQITDISLSHVHFVHYSTKGTRGTWTNYELYVSKETKVSNFRKPFCHWRPKGIRESETVRSSVDITWRRVLTMWQGL